MPAFVNLPPPSPLTISPEDLRDALRQALSMTESDATEAAQSLLARFAGMDRFIDITHTAEEQRARSKESRDEERFGRAILYTLETVGILNTTSTLPREKGEYHNWRDHYWILNTPSVVKMAWMFRNPVASVDDPYGDLPSEAWGGSWPVNVPLPAVDPAPPTFPERVPPPPPLAVRERWSQTVKAVQDFAVQRLREGASRNVAAREVKERFGISRDPTTLWRWARRVGAYPRTIVSKPGPAPKSGVRGTVTVAQGRVWNFARPRATARP